VGRASVRHVVPPGRVDEIAAELRPAVGGVTLVALGGGRVIDVAKALAAAEPPRRVVAIPTTLSGAEMTAIHRLPAGSPPGLRTTRPAVVVNDPGLSASQPEPELLASAMNALGHAAEAPLTPGANPVATMAADRAVELIAGGVSEDVDRDALALAALLGGYAIGGAGYGLHHVMSQTLVREAGLGHGPANAGMLPHTTAALAERFPARAEALDLVREVALVAGPRAGAARLRDLGVPPERIAELAEVAALRPELRLTPPPAEASELAAIYRAAW